MAVMLHQEKNRLPILHFEFGINPFDFFYNFINEFFILWDHSAAGRPQLNKGKFTSKTRIILQQIFNGTESFQDTFGIIQAVYPNPKEIGPEYRVSLELFPYFLFL